MNKKIIPPVFSEQYFTEVDCVFKIALTLSKPFGQDC